MAVENNEQWKIIDEYDNYEISSHGRVRRKGSPSFLSPILSRCYYYVNIYKDSKPHATNIHKLVAHAFCENPNDYDIVNHIDKNKTNNMFDNLCWCTIRERVRHIPIKKNNTSGIHGIAQDKNSWRARWCDHEGKAKSKSFSIAKYGDDEAKALAIEWRKARELEIG